ncbi:HVO_2922 family protein [Halorarum halophilum]|uniref:HVO_2922 family protein n=1 Tax=Halorarum halophilum TaxID=2743090 RepID=UPI001FE8E5FF|nr:HVO_2922 family protein [Halobaculum halophilum]
MSRDDDYESELTASREEIAAVLSGVADGILTGSIRFGDGADAVAVDVPDELSLEIELETEDDELALELELEWPTSAGEFAPSPMEALPDEADALPASVGAADASRSLARFELFRDRNEEWRWRLRHRNGNVIANSGEGYTRKHNAWKGLRSVMRNAPEAEVTEDTTD